MSDAKLIPLQELYLNTLCQLAAADKLDTIQQEFKEGGRLWLVSQGTTVPAAQIAYCFDVDAVTFHVITRDERKFTKVVRFAEGLDGFLEELCKFLHANRIGFNAGAPGKASPIKGPVKATPKSGSSRAVLNALPAPAIVDAQYV